MGNAKIEELGLYVEVRGKQDVAFTDFFSPSTDTLRNISVICGES